MKKILSVGLISLLGGIIISSSSTAKVSFITNGDGVSFGVKSRQVFDAPTCPDGTLENCPKGCLCNNVDCYGGSAYQIIGAKDGYTYDGSSLACHKIEKVMEKDPSISDVSGSVDCDAKNYPLISETPGCIVKQDRCVDVNGIQRYGKCQKCTQFKGHLFTTSVQYDKWQCSSPYEALENGLCMDRTYNGLTTSWCNENCGVANSNYSTTRYCPDGTQKTYRFRAFSLICDDETDKKCQTCYDKDMIDPYRVIWDGDKPFKCDGTRTAYITAYESCSKHAKYPSSTINIPHCELVYYCDKGDKTLYRCGKCKNGYLSNGTGLCYECKIGDIWYSGGKCSEDYNSSYGSAEGVVIGKNNREFIVLSPDPIVATIGKGVPSWNNWTKYCGSIPSKEEAEVLFENLDVINAGFKKMGASRLYHSFWTSTPSTSVVNTIGGSTHDFYAWLAVPEAGDGSFEKKLVEADRSQGYSIRCVHRHKFD